MKPARCILRGLLPVLVVSVLLFPQASIFADVGVELWSYQSGLAGYLISHSTATPFNLPEQMVTKGDFTAFNLNGQPSIPIAGIKGIYNVSNLTLINGIGGVSELKADVAIGFELGAFSDLDVYAHTSAGALAQYGQDPVGGVVGLTPQTVPLGSNLSADELRTPGTYHDSLQCIPSFP